MAIFLEGLLKTSVICAGFILIIALISPFLKKGHTVFWRYILWIVIGIRLVLPFDFSLSEYAFPLPFLAALQENRMIQKDNGNVNKTGDAQEQVLNNGTNGAALDSSEKIASGEVVYQALQVGQDEAEKSRMELPIDKKTKKETNVQLLYYIWAFVTVILFLFQGGSYWIFNIKLNRTKRYLWNKENIPVFTSEMVQSPMLAGIYRPQIILPEQHFTKEQIEFVISHEFAHYKRKDLAVKFLFACGRTLHWFNPFVYYMEQRAEKDIELLCDSEVVCNFSKEEKKEYSQMLLAYASGNRKGNRLLCVSRFSKKTYTLKERFSNIFSNTGRKKGIVIAVTGIGAVLCVSLFLAFGWKENVSKSSQQSKSETRKEKHLDTTSSVKNNPVDLAQSDKELKMPELSLEKAANMPYGAVFPRLIYASSNRAILYDYWGMLIYNIKEEAIEQILDLQALDLAHMQGSTVTEIEVSEDGSQILFYNKPDTKEKYLYDIDKKKLEYTQKEHFEHAFEDVVWGENQYVVLNTTAPADLSLLTKAANVNTMVNTNAIAYLSCDSLKTKRGKGFHGYDMMGLSLVIKDNSLGEAKVFPLFKEYYEAQGKTAFAYCKYKDAQREVISKKYLYEDEEGWRYYLEQDQKKESRIQEFAPVLDPLLLVRRKGEERQILEDLIIPEMISWCPVLFVEGRIVYQAAPKAEMGGVKDPVLVSIAFDGSDRKTADDILYHDFDHLCEDQGWIYYAGWTNDNGFPQPLCRISADFRTGPQFVQNIPGRLIGVEDGVAYYLTDRSKQAGIYWCNLKTGEEQLYDKWGVAADELSFFNSQEILFIEDGEIVSGSHLIFSYDDQDEVYTTNIKFKTD